MMIAFTQRLRRKYMAKIMIAASNGIVGVPEQVSEWIAEYTRQGHTFVVGDHKTSDGALHRALSCAGAANNTEIYCMAEPIINTYQFKVHKFITKYSEDNKRVTLHTEDDTEVGSIDGIEKEMDIPLNRKWYEFADRQMITDSCMAIIILTGDTSKRMESIIQYLNILNKPCYVFRV